MDRLSATRCALCVGLALVIWGAGPGSTAADSTRNAMPPGSPAFKPPANPLFVDDFHGATITKWRTDREGVWSIKRGMLRAELPDRRQEHSILFTGDSTWTDYALEVDVCGMRGVDKGVVVRLRGTRGLGLDLRGPGYHDLRLQMNELPIARANIENGNGVWQHVRFEVRGARCRIWVNGESVIDRRVPLSLSKSGGIALAAYTGGIGECTVYYDNVVVTALPPDSGPAR